MILLVWDIEYLSEPIDSKYRKGNCSHQFGYSYLSCFPDPICSVRMQQIQKFIWVFVALYTPYFGNRYKTGQSISERNWTICDIAVIYQTIEAQVNQEVSQLFTTKYFRRAAVYFALRGHSSLHLSPTAVYAFSFRHHGISFPNLS